MPQEVLILGKQKLGGIHDEILILPTDKRTLKTATFYQDLKKGHLGKRETYITSKDSTDTHTSEGPLAKYFRFFIGSGEFSKHTGKYKTDEKHFSILSSLIDPDQVDRNFSEDKTEITKESCKIAGDCKFLRYGHYGAFYDRDNKRYGTNVFFNENAETRDYSKFNDQTLKFEGSSHISVFTNRYSSKNTDIIEFVRVYPHNKMTLTMEISNDTLRNINANIFLPLTRKNIAGRMFYHQPDTVKNFDATEDTFLSQIKKESNVPTTTLPDGSKGVEFKFSGALIEDVKYYSFSGSGSSATYHAEDSTIISFERVYIGEYQVVEAINTFYCSSCGSIETTTLTAREDHRSDIENKNVYDPSLASQLIVLGQDVSEVIGSALISDYEMPETISHEVIGASGNPVVSASNYKFLTFAFSFGVSRRGVDQN